MGTSETRPNSLLSRRDTLRLGLLAAGGASAASLRAGVRRTSEATAEMKLGSDSPAGHPFNIGPIYPDAQLGGEEAMTAGLKIGSIDGLFASTGVLSSSVPELGVFGLPFLFRDLDHVLSS